MKRARFSDDNFVAAVAKAARRRKAGPA